MANNDNFAQDVTDNQLNGNAENGGGDGHQEHNSAEAPGRDDDRCEPAPPPQLTPEDAMVYIRWLTLKKLFVGGLSWETTDKELRDHFGAYGEIESINVKTDPNTGRSRGFAFIVFKAPDSIDKVMAAGEHTINGKKVDPKKAKARHGKIFVGGLSSEISDEEIKNFFGNFGNIVEVEMPFDKTKNQRKGFCFITFESEQVVNELLKTPKQTIAGKEVDVKRATPKPDGPGGIGQRGGRGGRGMRGGRGGRGGYGGHGGAWSNQGYGGYGYGQGGYGGGLQRVRRVRGRVRRARSSPRESWVPRGQAARGRRRWPRQPEAPALLNTVPADSHLSPIVRLSHRSCASPAPSRRRAGGASFHSTLINLRN